MFKSKPTWLMWLAWLIVYTMLDMTLAWMIHSRFTWSDFPDAFEGALLAATITWLISLYKWHKADSGL
ncbi:MAG: hypothetical protein V4555_22040 [Acidobacteriota bacterium]